MGKVYVGINLEHLDNNSSFDNGASSAESVRFIEQKKAKNAYKST